MLMFAQRGYIISPAKKRFLKLLSFQVEDLAVMYHLELGPAKGKSNSKALYVTAQTAELSTGGMLQVSNYVLSPM